MENGKLHDICLTRLNLENKKLDSTWHKTNNGKQSGCKVIVFS